MSMGGGSSRTKVKRVERVNPSPTAPMIGDSDSPSLMAARQIQTSAVSHRAGRGATILSGSGAVPQYDPVSGGPDSGKEKYKTVEGGDGDASVGKDIKPKPDKDGDGKPDTRGGGGGGDKGTGGGGDLTPGGRNRDFKFTTTKKVDKAKETIAKWNTSPKNGMPMSSEVKKAHSIIAKNKQNNRIALENGYASVKDWKKGEGIGKFADDKKGGGKSVVSGGAGASKSGDRKNGGASVLKGGKKGGDMPTETKKPAAKQPDKKPAAKQPDKKPEPKKEDKPKANKGKAKSGKSVLSGGKK